MEEKIVYEGFVKVKEVPVNIKDNVHIYNEICVKDAVAAILIDENGKYGLVTQYRPLAKSNTKEIVAETLDKENLTPYETLVEGLKEEAGIEESEILFSSKEPIFEYCMMIGCSNSKISIYEIFVKAQENKDINDTEVEYVEWVTLEEFKTLVNNKEIKDSKTLLAYYYLLSKILEEEKNITGDDKNIIA